MTESAGSTQPPDWYRNPPEWLREPPQRRSRYRDDDDDRYDRDRARGRDRDDSELVTAIRAMPEAVVSALKEAIQGAQQSQQSQQTGGQQQQQQPENKETEKSGDDKPREQLSFADKWFSNSL